MARSYVRNALPDSPEALAELLSDPRRAASVYGDAAGDSAQRFHRAYMSAAAKRDPSIGAQVRAQLGTVRSGRGMPGNAAERLYRPEAPGAGLDGLFASLGEFAQAVKRGSPKLDQVRRVMDSFSSEVPDAGGFLLPEELRSDLMLLSLQQSIVRPRAIVFPASTARIGVPAIDDTTHASSIMGGVVAYWAEESATITESQATYERVILDAKKLVALASAPNEFMADAPVFDVYLRTVVPKAVAWYEDKSFISGTGVGEPQGYRNSPCLIKVTRGTSSHISFPDIPAMLARLLPQSLDSACWVCSPSALVDMLSVYQNFGSATTGVIPPSMWVERTPAGWTLLGMPLEISEHAAALGTAGDLSLVDLGMYLIADLEVGTLDISPHFKFSTDVSELRYRARVDGRYWLTSPVTPDDGGSTLSGVVVLN